MRLFIASRVIVKEYAQIREAFAEVLEGRWVKEEHLHLTWVFLGERDDPEPWLERLATVLPLAHEVQMRGLGSFGRPPKVLFAGEKKPVLFKKASQFRSAGFEMDRFRPHVTLCRIKKIHDRAAFREKLHAFKKMETVRVHREIGLYESRLTNNGPIYTRVMLQ